jgi:uncharacterized protein YndB with AHSA1/START domain
MSASAPFVITRSVAAPRARVWQAWTEVEHLRHWWGPKGFVVAHCTVDLRPGGLMHYRLRSPEGGDMWGRFLYREIVKPEKLVWVNSFSDEKGGVTRHPMAPGWPREMLTTVTFAEHLAHWFGPRGFTIHSCEADARPGGLFRLCMRLPQGQDYWVRGSFREIAPPGRVVIHCFADDARGVQRLEEVITVSLADEGGKTRLTLHATAAGSGAEAAAMLAGMEQGWSETLDRLRERSGAIT